jgi:uncharacterized protein DUF992
MDKTGAIGALVAKRMRLQMRKLFLAIAAVAALGTIGLTPETRAGERVKIGLLKCSISGANDGARQRRVSLFVSADRALDCLFESSTEYASEEYSGTFRRIGPAIGRVDSSNLVWAVFATGYGGENGKLEGVYRGLSAEATLGVGVGANVLVGGFDRSVTLQPVSVQTQLGLNIALGGASLDLQLR